MADAITVHCPSCETAFPVDPDKVPEGGVNARCSECADIFRVEEPTPATEAEPGTPDDFQTPEGLPGLDVAEPEASEVEAPEPGAEIPEVEEEEEDAEETEEEAFATDEGWATDYFSAPVTEETDEEEPAESGGMTAAGLPDLEETPEAEPEDVEPAETETGETEKDTLPRMEEPGIAGPELDIADVETAPFEGADVETEAAPEAAAPEGTEVEEDAETVDVEEDVTGIGAESGAIEREGVEEEEETATEPRRPTFGNRSPEEKAQRLARVLVSDMITYNPNMYETALARGTLKEDFAEEIEKSWEEYVEQVGEELATSTSHWTDALNDILAKGEETF